jgi:hypothetical protein
MGKTLTSLQHWLTLVPFTFSDIPETWDGKIVDPCAININSPGCTYGEHTNRQDPANV